MTLHNAPPGSALTVRQFFESVYMQRPRMAAGSPRSAEACRNSITVLERFAGENVTLGDLSDELIQAAMAHFLAIGEKSPMTANKHGKTWLAIWRYAWRRRYVDTQTRWVEFYRPLKREPQAWSLAEVNAILEAASQRAGRIGDVPAAVFWVALILFAYNTGARIAAIIKTRTANLELDSGWVLISAEHQKQRSDQRFALFSETIDALKRLAPAKRGLERIFGDWTAACGKPLLKHYKRILQAANLPAGPRDKFHKIRRTTVTHVAAAAGELVAQQVAGHSHVNVTRAYIDRRFQPSPNTADLLPRPQVPRLGKKGGLP